MTMDPYAELTLYQRSAALMAAAKLGVFAALADGPLAPPQVADRIAASADAVARLLSALAAHDYVAVDGEKFALNDFSRSFLREGVGGMLRLAWKEHVFYTLWSRLDEAVSTSKALLPSFPDRVARDFPSIERFLLALNDLAEMAAPGVIATGAFGGAATILDLGGGGGGYGAELARALPSARVTLADLSEILPVARGHLERKRIGDQVELVSADFLKDGCGLAGRQFDCVFLSHVLHDFDAPTAAAIVQRAARLVRSGGRLVILDVLVPDGGQKNPVEALFDLMMLVEVPGGRSHRIADVTGWMQSAGMALPTSHKLYFGILIEAAPLA
jgi:ubiquinone/menaquinone biosynthesis C-methylase UbiE